MRSEERAPESLAYRTTRGQLWVTVVVLLLGAVWAGFGWAQAGGGLTSVSGVMSKVGLVCVLVSAAYALVCLWALARLRVLGYLCTIFFYALPAVMIVVGWYLTGRREGLLNLILLTCAACAVLIVMPVVGLVRWMSRGGKSRRQVRAHIAEDGYVTAEVYEPHDADYELDAHRYGDEGGFADSHETHEHEADDAYPTDIDSTRELPRPRP